MVTGYSRTQIALHWLVALFILYNLLLGDDMSWVWRGFRNTGTATMTTGAWVHIIIGSLVLVLVLWRLMLRLTRGVPAGPEGETPMMEMAGAAGHWALYALMLGLPITGLLAWYGGVTSLGGLHGGILKMLLWVVIGVHVLAALWHQFIRKDGLMNRMRKAQD